MEGADSVGGGSGGGAGSVGASEGVGGASEARETREAVSDAARDVSAADVDKQASEVLGSADVDGFDAPDRAAAAKGEDDAAKKAEDEAPTTVAAAGTVATGTPTTPAAAQAKVEEPSTLTTIGQTLKGYATGAVNFALAPVNGVNALTNLAISPFTDYRFATNMGIAPTSRTEALAQRGMENALTVGTLALGVGELAAARTGTASLRGAAELGTGTAAATDLNAAIAASLARGETVLVRGVAPAEAMGGARVAEGGFSYASGTAAQPAFAIDRATLSTLSREQIANIEANAKFYADTGATLERAAAMREAAGLPQISGIGLKDYAAAYGIEEQGMISAFSVPAGTRMTSLAATANVDANVARYVVDMPRNATPLGSIGSALFALPR